MPTVLAPAPRIIPPPESTQPVSVFWSRTISIGLIHLVALLAFVPWFFSWTGVVLAVVGHWLYGMLGITLGYHRLLTHRGFDCPKWLEYTFAMLGVCCLQDSPARWVAWLDLYVMNPEGHESATTNDASVVNR